MVVSGVARQRSVLPGDERLILREVVEQLSLARAPIGELGAVGAHRQQAVTGRGEHALDRLEHARVARFGRIQLAGAVRRRQRERGGTDGSVLGENRGNGSTGKQKANQEQRDGSGRHGLPCSGARAAKHQRIECVRLGCQPSGPERAVSQRRIVQAAADYVRALTQRPGRRRRGWLRRPRAAWRSRGREGRGSAGSPASRCSPRS